MKALKIIGIIAGVIALLVGGLAVTGQLGGLMFLAVTTWHQPSPAFDGKGVVAAPDYADQKNWAALPTMADPADLVPEGVAVAPQGSYPVDTFYIHPTGYLNGASWTSPMDPESGTEENTKWMMANQASAYNGSSNIYAPRYREATIFSYFQSPEERDRVLGFAFEDVKRAFEYYLEHHNEGKPFILASHSQGAHHSMRLLAEVIDRSELHERMVAAYVIGAVMIPLSPEWFAGLENIKPCESANDLGCVIHWDTMPEGAEPIERPADSLCTNPLSWRVDSELVASDSNKGAVAPEGSYVFQFGKVADAGTGQKFEVLTAPQPGKTSAQCRDGSLFATRQTDAAFAAMGGGGPGDSYHGLDYALFYMDVHENAKLRAATYFGRGTQWR